jgi:hypothetical protein
MKNKEINFDFLIDNCLKILQYRNYCDLKDEDQKEIYSARPLATSSKVLPFVSGILNLTQNNWQIIILQKKMKTVAGPTSLNRNGIKEGINAAKIQCTELPNDCPEALNLFGKISEIKTHITAPCPMACDAMKTKKKTGTAIPFQLNKNAIDTSPREMMYPKDPKYINFFLPYLSIKAIPDKVNIKLRQ